MELKFSSVAFIAVQPFASGQTLFFFFFFPESTASLAHRRNGVWTAGHLPRVCLHAAYPTPMSMGMSFDLVQTISSIRKACSASE